MYYFYIPGSFSTLEPVEVIDKVKRGMYSGETLEQKKAHTPKVVILDLDGCLNAIRNAAKMPLELINQKTFDLFYSTSIMDEYITNRGCTFKCREFNAADIVTCFASVNVNCMSFYFTFRDVEALTHDQILDRTYEYIETTLLVNVDR
ncbi:hypothetical protein CRT22_23965 [Escherichia sp. E5028]|uniref:hypothetical protein n=1 Tax=Escherichia sp. E5028 TaxID=2044602 RepID=UPI00107EF7D5|nr:hypothetical protein [Escherichia sp. E5028]TGB52866.1 hypothetical protein CRT22_23965 [Escherichia sp. E5028]